MTKQFEYFSNKYYIFLHKRINIPLFDKIIQKIVKFKKLIKKGEPMKKIFIAVSICLCLLGGVLFAGCNNNKIISAEVKQGTIETTVLKDQNLDTQNLVVVFTLGNKKTVEVGADKLTLGQIDTSALGKQL